MKVAIVHDWLTSYGGAETFVELWLTMYPDADIYTLVYDKKALKGHFEHNRIFTSPMQRLPFATKIYRKLLKWMPRAFESFNLSGYDLVLISSSACAKGVIVPPFVPCVAYIHTPMRYAWDLFFDYRKRSGWLTRFFMDRWMPGIREWDYISAQRIDTIIANSCYIARRIKRFWGRDAEVIYSPVNTNRFYAQDTSDNAENSDKDGGENGFYVVYSRMVQYKRMDIAIKAIKGSGRNLIVIGNGPEEKRLKEAASGDKNIVFLGRVSDEVLRDRLQRCRAMLFCAEEDFGLGPIETMACGRPVIAFGRGGATETVIDGVTGVLFEKQETKSLYNAIERFERLEKEGAFKKDVIIERALSFSTKRFKKEFMQAVEKTVAMVKQQ